MLVQELAYAIQDQNKTIMVVSEKSRESFETSAYLLKKLLYTTENISADNIEITVNDKDFDAIKKYLNK